MEIPVILLKIWGLIYRSYCVFLAWEFREILDIAILRNIQYRMTDRSHPIKEEDSKKNNYIILYIRVPFHSNRR